MLTDQALLAKVGMWVKPALTRQVSDQVLLAKIAVEAEDRQVRGVAVRELTDDHSANPEAKTNEENVVPEDTVRLDYEFVLHGGREEVVRVNRS